MNSKNLHQSIYNKIVIHESPQEAESISMLLLEHVFGISRMDIIVEKEVTVNESDDKELKQFIKRLAEGEPIQHIIGSVEFYGRKFLVNKNVLIPRPETEELVDMLLKNHPDLTDMNIIDIGTGSGIIPITIKKERPGAILTGIDISTAALATAKRNATLNHAEINFYEIDILHDSSDVLKDADIIISNPPYITLREKGAMDRKVTDREPQEALFVPNEQPLLFYECITQLAAKHLHAEGYLYFEINEQYGQATKSMIESNNFKKVRLYKDMQGKDRFITAQLA